MCVCVCVQSITDMKVVVNGLQHVPRRKGCLGDAGLQVQRAAGWEGRGERGGQGPGVGYISSKIVYLV